MLMARQEAIPPMARQPRSDTQVQPGAEAPGRQTLALPAPVRLRAPGCRPALRTVDEAIHMIDTELPAELRRLPRWTFAHALLVEATKTGRKRDLTAAVRQVRQALSNEGWLIENEAAGG
jgi:hypothetical protein